MSHGMGRVVFQLCGLTTIVRNVEVFGCDAVAMLVGGPGGVLAGTSISVLDMIASVIESASATMLSRRPTTVFVAVGGLLNVVPEAWLTVASRTRLVTVTSSVMVLVVLASSAVKTADVYSLTNLEVETVLRTVVNTERFDEVVRYVDN